MRVTVIGSGIIGLAIAYQLEKLGVEVLRFDDGKPQGSAGETRIFRVFHENPLLEEDAREASRLWSQWEEETGERLIRRSGLWLRGSWSNGAGYEQEERVHPLSNLETRYAVDREGGIGMIKKTMKTLEDNLKGEHRLAKVVEIENGRILLENGEILRSDFVFLAAGRNTHIILGRSARVMQHARFLFPFLEEPEEIFPAIIDRDLHFYAVAEAEGLALGVRGDEEIGAFTKGMDHEQRRRKNIFIEQRRIATEGIVRQYFPGLYPKACDLVYCIRGQREDDGYEIIRDRKLFAVSGNNLFKFAPLLARFAAEELEKA